MNQEINSLSERVAALEEALADWRDIESVSLSRVAAMLDTSVKTVRRLIADRTSGLAAYRIPPASDAGLGSYRVRKRVVIDFIRALELAELKNQEA